MRLESVQVEQDLLYTEYNIAQGKVIDPYVTILYGGISNFCQYTFIPYLLLWSYS